MYVYMSANESMSCERVQNVIASEEYACLTQEGNGISSISLSPSLFVLREQQGQSQALLFFGLNQFSMHYIVCVMANELIIV